MDYFSLRQLASEWSPHLSGATIEDAWTQARGELSMLIHAPDDSVSTLRVGCDPSFPFLFRADGGGRQKRNTSAVFEPVVGLAISFVKVADRDRHLFLVLSDGSAIQIMLFGSRPNALLVRDGLVDDAFLRASDWIDQAPPEPRAAPDPQSASDFEARWTTNAKTLGQAVRRTAPLLPPLIARDVCFVAGYDPEASTSEAGVSELSAAYESRRGDLEHGAPTVYASERWVEACLPVPLHAPPDGWTEEAFESQDQASRHFTRRSLGQRRFRSLFQPVDTALAAAHSKRKRSADAMLDELSHPSRADIYERWAHLLMARNGVLPAGHEEVSLPDIIGGGEPVTIPLDASISSVQNAERLYDRARRARRRREEAESRWETVSEDAEAAGSLLERLRAVQSSPDLESFLSEEHEALGRLLRRESLGEEPESFRRIALPGGLEALVGKNARGNAELTTRIAQPHDYWLHARGVPGSHVVVRRPSRTWQAPDTVLDAAAAVAAYYSNARSQPLAPVTVTERKYVRPIKGGPPGLVRIDREDVRIVEPGLPTQAATDDPS